MLVKGNGFAQIIRNGAGWPIELKLLHPDDVTVYESEGELYYKVVGMDRFLYSDEMFHVPGFTFDGKVGISVIRYAADNLSMNLSADAFAVDAYDDRAITYGVIETETTGLNESGKKNLKKIFEANLDTGKKNRVTVLDDGMKYKPISLSPQEAMFIEAKASGVADIARWLNIPLHKLHVSGEGGYNFLVQMSMEYLQATIQPLAEQIKQEVERKLITERGKSEGEYAYFNYKKLLEVDPKTRAEYYKNMVYIKAMNPNEVRKLEDMNPYDGGDDFLQMANMMTEEQIKKELQDA
jgi:HK97 family phage portal protein